MSTPRILVVNNDEGFGFMLKEGLANTGQFEASLLHTGSDALQAVVENSYDLVIVDIAITDIFIQRDAHLLRQILFIVNH